MTCLIIVERGVSEKNNITALIINSGIKSFFKSLKNEIDAEKYSQVIMRNQDIDRSHIVVHGVSHEISLTSVLLGTILDKEKIPFSIVDADDVLRGYGDYIKQKINEVPVVAISTTYTMGIKTIEDILAFIREHTKATNPNLKIILGGQSLHAWLNNDFIGQKMFEHLRLADYLVFGEADITFGDIVRKIAKGKSVAGIEGVVCKNGDGFTGSTKRVMVKAHEIASPDWGILRKYDINNLGTNCRPESVGIEEGRGCIFRCSFCSYSSEVTFRRKDADVVIEELKNIQSNGIHRLSFLGAEFFNPKKFSEPVLTKIGQLNFPLDIWAFGRLDIIADDPHFADLLQEANFTTIQFGMESGSPKILKAMNKKINAKNISKASQMLRDRNIKVKASIIIGFPRETKDTLNETKKILKQCNFDEIMLHGLVVLPGTPLYKNREKFGIRMTPNGWVHETMGVTDLPHHIQDMIIFLTQHTDTFILNIGQNITPKFFKASPSELQVRRATRILQKILCKEWHENGHDCKMEFDRVSLLNELLNEVDFIPAEYFPKTLSR